MAEGLHVAYYAPSWPPGRGRPNGIVTATSQVVPAMRRRGHEVSVLATDYLGEGDERAGALVRPRRPLTEAVIRRLPSPRAVAGWRAKLLAEDVARGFEALAQRRPLDLIEVEETFGIAYFLQRRLKLPVVTRLHGPWRVGREALGASFTEGDRQRIRLEERAVARSAGVSAPSRSALSAFPEREGPTAVIANALPLPERQWSADKAVPGRIAFIARMDTPKGADTAILAAVRLIEAGRDVELVLCGPDHGIGPMGDTLPLRAYLDKHVPAGMQARFDYRGTVTPEEAAALRLESAAVLVASRYETFSYTVAEALVAGCPMVAAASGGIKEIVEDGRTGLLFPAGDAEAAAGALDRAVFGGEGPSLGAAARGSAAEKMDPSRLAERTEGFYREVIAAWR